MNSCLFFPVEEETCHFDRLHVEGLGQSSCQFMHRVERLYAWRGKSGDNTATIPSCMLCLMQLISQRVLSSSSHSHRQCSSLSVNTVGTLTSLIDTLSRHVFNFKEMVESCIKDMRMGWISTFNRWQLGWFLMFLINIWAAEDMFWCLIEIVEEERELIEYKLTASVTEDQKENKTPTQMSFCFTLTSTSGLIAGKHRWNKILWLPWDGSVDNKQQKE